MMLVNIFIPQVYVPQEVENYLKQDCILQSLMQEADSHTPMCKPMQSK